MNPAALRLAGLGVVLAGISLITFTLNHFAPGDKATIIAHARYPEVLAFPPDLLQAIRAEFHLEKPFLVQYSHWIANILQADFGVSYTSASASGTFSWRTWTRRSR